MSASKILPKFISNEEKINILNPLLLQYYNENKKFDKRGIDNCRYLPSYNTIKTIYNFSNNIFLYDYFGLKIDKNYYNHFYNTHKYTYNEVKNIFYNFGHTLLTSENEYKNSNQLLYYRCKCGNYNYKSVQTLLKVPNCVKCPEAILSHLGENNPSWLGGISSERDKVKQSEEYKKWRKDVYERDNYTCQCCGDKSGHNLEAHHILNFSDHEELRYDINNGITLCKNCHNPRVKGSFHNIYGTYNNTKEQLNEYINMYHNKLNN